MTQTTRWTLRRIALTLAFTGWMPSTSADVQSIVDDVVGTPTTKKITVGNLRPAVSKVIQVVNFTTGDVDSGTGTIPGDDTIPENTEGNEFMTLAITPTDAAHKLRVEAELFLCGSTTSVLAAAIFRDSGVNALAAARMPGTTVGTMLRVVLAEVVAGSVSTTTFKVRAGTASAATTTFNGVGGAPLYGGVFASFITITEFVP